MTERKELLQLICSHGRYQDIRSYRMSEIVCNATVVFYEGYHHPLPHP